MKDMMNVVILTTLFCLVLINTSVTMDTDYCKQVCDGTIVVHDESEAAHCGCDPHSHNHKHHTTTVSADLLHEKTTLSMCDYLCSIQMGGAACDCSAPIVPGRRSKLLETLTI